MRSRRWVGVPLISKRASGVRLNCSDRAPWSRSRTKTTRRKRRPSFNTGSWSGTISDIIGRRVMAGDGRDLLPSRQLPAGALDRARKTLVNPWRHIAVGAMVYLAANVAANSCRQTEKTLSHSVYTLPAKSGTLGPIASLDRKSV